MDWTKHTSYALRSALSGLERLRLRHSTGPTPFSDIVSSFIGNFLSVTLLGSVYKNDGDEKRGRFLSSPGSVLCMG